MAEMRELECTECSESRVEIGEEIKKRAGDVVMRFCEPCKKPTVHVILSRGNVKDEAIADEIAAMERGQVAV